MLLALDGGQTGTRALLARADGTVLGEGSASPIRHMFAGGGEESRAAIHAAVREAYLAASIEPGTLSAAACGVTGVQPNSLETDAVERFLLEVVRPKRILVVPDYVTNLLGASNGLPGIVVVAGGGSVAYGRSNDGREAVAGGFGYLLGDEGGGYDIGRRAIAAAIWALDGRGRETSLSNVVCRAFELQDLTEIKRVVYVPHLPRERIAGLVPHVVRVAEQGDEVARGILDGAARELAQLALAVTNRLYKVGDHVDVYPTGGVFAVGELLTGPFCETLSSEWPWAEVRVPAHPPIVGARILAQQLASAGP